MSSTVSKDFEKQVQGYGLTTAHILYRRPDHRCQILPPRFGAQLRND